MGQPTNPFRCQISNQIHMYGGCILCFADRASLYNLVNKANLVHNFSQYVYFYSLRVSGDYVHIIWYENQPVAHIE